LCIDKFIFLKWDESVDLFVQNSTMSPITTVVKAFLGPDLTAKIRPLGHGLKAWSSSWMMGRPASKMTIIGINATKGKTSTTILTGRLMNVLGIKTGYISTAVINTSGRKKNEVINRHKNTTIDGFLMQKYLQKMADSGCTHAILEMSSQGLEAHRHWGLSGFDVAVFMNIYPEHLEAHGGMQQYIDAKSKLFQNIKKNGTAILTADPEFADTAQVLWNAIPAKKQDGVTKISVEPNHDFEIAEKKNSLYKSLVIQGNKYPTQSTADFEIYNLFYALTVARTQCAEIEEKKLKQACMDITQTIPGRMEFVKIAGRKPFQIIVDYAHEPGSMKQLMHALQDWKKRGFYDKIIHVVSCDGVGRDDWKKPILGRLSYDNADFSVVTTDNYEAGDDPMAIVEMLAQTFPANQRNRKYIKVIHRKDAMAEAIRKAQSYSKQDGVKKIVIVSTGVGTEQHLTQPDGRLKWDEHQVWKRVVKRMTS